MLLPPPCITAAISSLAFPRLWSPLTSAAPSAAFLSLLHPLNIFRSSSMFYSTLQLLVSFQPALPGFVQQVRLCCSVSRPCSGGATGGDTAGRVRSVLQGFSADASMLTVVALKAPQLSLLLPVPLRLRVDGLIQGDTRTCHSQLTLAWMCADPGSVSL